MGAVSIFYTCLRVCIIQIKSFLTFCEIWKSSWLKYAQYDIIAAMAAKRIVTCDKCGRELEVRSAFAHITLSNHKKVCEKAWPIKISNVILRKVSGGYTRTQYAKLYII